MNDGTRIGLVAFLDILGYQNLLQRNEPEKIAAEVLPILLGIKEKIKIRFLKNLKNQESEDIAKFVMENMKCLSFSDTILLTLPTDSEAIDKDGYSPSEVFKWMVFLFAADIVQQELFNAGLPARGAIDYGKFYVKDTCFAGKTIVNAYQQSQQIEIAACVLTSDAEERLRSLEKESGKPEFEGFVLEYLVPKKAEREQHMLLVSSTPVGIESSNVHESVMRAFWGHQKDIPQAVRPKIINTEQWFEFQLQSQK